MITVSGCDLLSTLALCTFGNISLRPKPIAARTSTKCTLKKTNKNAPYLADKGHFFIPKTVPVAAALPCSLLSFYREIFPSYQTVYR